MSCISKTKVISQAIADDTELLAEIFDEVTSCIIALDRHGLVVKANHSAEKLLGQELIGKRWSNVVNTCFAPRADDGNEVSLTNGRKVLVSTKPLSVGQLIVLTDVTTTRQLQARIGHMERLSSLGRMAASLAHQIRTPLQAAMLYASNLGNKSITASARAIFGRKLMDRLVDLENQVRDILLFAKSGEHVAENVEITTLVDSIRKGADGIMARNGATFEVRTDEPPMKVVANSIALASAINNLISNAVEAGANRVVLDVRKCEQEVVLKIADNGKGMSTELVQKSFEPFFTTKSNGTGLGLAVVSSVIKAHQGNISVMSAEGKGTCFTITLPLATINKAPCEEHGLSRAA